MEDFLDKFAKVKTLHKAGGLVVFCILLAVVNHFVFYTPIVDQQEKLQKEIKSLETELENKRKIVAELTSYRLENERLFQDLQRALKLLPESSEIDTMLNKISAQAKKAGLRVEQFKPMAESAKGFYAQIPIKLELKGSFVELTSFFDSVAKLSRIVSIGNFSFDADQSSGKKTAGQETSSKKLVKSKVDLFTYRFLPTKIEAVDPKAGKDAKDGKKADGKDEKKTDAKDEKKADAKEKK